MHGPLRPLSFCAMRKPNSAALIALTAVVGTSGFIAGIAMREGLGLRTFLIASITLVGCLVAAILAHGIGERGRQTS
jgi:hypothetical protein